MMKIKSKKGIALNQAFGAILVLVLIGVLVIVAIFLFVNLNSTFTNLEDIAVNNYNITSSQVGNLMTVDNASLCNFAGFAVTVITNGTSAEVIPANNYTVDAGAGTITNNTGEFIESWVVNYTGNYGGPACVATTEMITQFGTFPVLIGLVGTIIFLGLVVGVLVLSFAFGGRRV